jgi:hypothetical protein
LNVRKIAPIALLLLGIFVMLAAFLFGAANAIPYPDPTAELLAHQAAEATKWNLVAGLGLLISACSGVWLWRRQRTKIGINTLQ